MTLCNSVHKGALLTLLSHSDNDLHNITLNPGLGSGLASPRLWTSLLGFIVVLLAIFMIFQVLLLLKCSNAKYGFPQNVVSFKRAKKILPLLQKESAGPYSDTTVKDGIILTKVDFRRNV